MTIIYDLLVLIWGVLFIHQATQETDPFYRWLFFIGGGYAFAIVILLALGFFR